MISARRALLLPLFEPYEPHADEVHQDGEECKDAGVQQKPVHDSFPSVPVDGRAIILWSAAVGQPSRDGGGPETVSLLGA